MRPPKDRDRASSMYYGENARASSLCEDLPVDVDLRRAIANAIAETPGSELIVKSLEMDAGGNGTVAYNPGAVWIDPSAPGFSGSATAITDEEMVRAYLLVRLVSTYEYPTETGTFEVERVYKPVGRPVGKGGRIDVLVREPVGAAAARAAFLFIECKAPDKFDEDLKYIDGQLFRLSRQEDVRPRYLVYYTVEMRAETLRERLILIDTATFAEFAAWDAAGQPITDALPPRFGAAEKRRYANVTVESEKQRPLDREGSEETFNRLRTEIHDVIWGGGGTNNNEVFVLITRLILCKIFDEKETAPGAVYRFQRLGDATFPESPGSVVTRLNALYKEAEAAYLALPTPSAGPAFDTTRISAEKIAYVVGRLEGLSVTENRHSGDLLGEFFEQIVAQDFTQTKGQFFTPVKLVRLMLELVDAAGGAAEVMAHQRDQLGRPRLPFVLDPACGSGTFLIEYMKVIRARLGGEDVAAQLPNRVREAHAMWFGGTTKSAWARDYLFGIENNYDLGLAAKVNMVLHGDGSMNTWIASGLMPFSDYWVEKRNNVLGIKQPMTEHPYAGERNEQFDVILSNPPFSLKLSPDERSKIGQVFASMGAGQSESIFIERWYQLLRDEGVFCCILPEAALDTSTSIGVRSFLMRMFRIEAVVSLPYDAFRPFTSTKTCIVMARKRTAAAIEAFNAELQNQLGDKGLLAAYAATLMALGWADEPIFMAEPAFAGYKRRKNLPDLPQPNELFREDGYGSPLASVPSGPPATVLDCFRAGPEQTADPKLGFWTTLRRVSERPGYRLDPKYRWLWDYEGGVVLGDADKSARLSTVVDIVDLPKVPKGELSEETRCIDLEHVERRQAIVSPEVPVVDVVGSDKVRFEGCDLAISRLEPYLGKIMILPPADAIGSTEWVGLKIKSGIPAPVLGYFLMRPEMCEAYRRLQSGKRHARFDPKEFLTLRAEFPESGAAEELLDGIVARRKSIVELRRQELKVRREIDSLFETVGEPGDS